MERVLNAIFSFVCALNFLGQDSYRQRLSKLFEDWKLKVGPAYFEQFKELLVRDIPLQDILEKHDCEFPPLEEDLA